MCSLSPFPKQHHQISNAALVPPVHLPSQLCKTLQCPTSRFTSSPSATRTVQSPGTPSPNLVKPSTNATHFQIVQYQTAPQMVHPSSPANMSLYDPTSSCLYGRFTNQIRPLPSPKPQNDYDNSAW
ncbi:hypothetical protein JB92DRAFT_110656 [Gautieria morchelliformis]|nr:hypothetical protein JB92DRAFT_110656 [Gautieria morchelliformis]